MDAGLIAATGAVFAGGVVSGLTGFGSAIVAVPPLLLIFDPPTVVAAAILLSILSGWVVLPGRMREIQLGTIARLLPWAFLGLVPGVVIIKAMPPAAIKLLAGVVVVALAAATAVGWRPPG
ncbi:MAG TPA: TSUP family transporter, partial [Thermomicrobiales bacterium]|nr:TSUP family transporter [Thermomicrobiales bacterium]